MAETIRTAAAGHDGLRSRAARTGIAWRPAGRAALALGALAFAFALVLALPATRAAAHNPAHSKVHNNNNNNNDNDDDSDNGGSTSAAPGTSAGGGTTSIGGDGNVGNAGGASLTSRDVNAGSSHGGFTSTIPLGGNGAAGPALGFGFNNNGASVGATIPFGGVHHLADRFADAPAEHASHSLVALPFERSNNSLVHALAPHDAGAPGGLSHALAYGETGTPGGLFAGPNPTRLIRSVTTTFSPRFVNRLNHSLRLQEPGDMRQVTMPPAPSGANDLASRLTQAKHAIASAAAAPASAPTAARSPASIVHSRFAGISPNALEARLFTVPSASETRYVPHEIVVGAQGLSTEQIAAIAHRNGLTPVAGGTVTSSGLTLQRWRISDNRPVGEVIRALEGETGLTAAQPNFRFALAQAAGLTSEPANGFTSQYAPAKLHLDQAHRLTTGSGVVVAVIDTGIDRLHPDLAGSILASFDATGAKEPPDAHGTAIAGAIVAHSRLIGVAPGARLLAIRAFSTAGPDAEATTMTIVRSIEWAVAHGARVINMSFAGARDPVIGRALAEAKRRGVVLIAAAGNAGPTSPPLYPAADANVIAVSATDVDNHLLDVANRGRQVALVAPGVDVLLPAPRARYQIATGTSFAAAEVAGIAALMIAKNPQLTPDEVRAELTSTARDLGPKGRDDMFGAGLADAFRAVEAASGATPQTVAAK